MLLAATEARADESFHDMVNNAPALGLPAVPTDKVPVVRGPFTYFIGPPLGNVVGSTPTAVSDIAVWNNTLGTSLRTGAPARVLDSQVSLPASGYTLSSITQSGVVGEDIYKQTSTYGGPWNWDALSGVAIAPAGTALLAVHGIAGYVRNQMVSTGPTRNGVGVLGVCVAEVNSSNCTGINTILTDNTSQIVSAHTGQVMTNEFDFNVTSPNTIISGLVLTGNSLSKPAFANGYVVAPLGGGFKWDNGYTTQDGTAVNGIALGGASSAAANISSQPIVFSTFDAGSVRRTLSLVAAPDYLELGASNGPGHGNFFLLHGSYFVADGSGFIINTRAALTGSVGQVTFGGDAAWTNVTVGNGTAPIYIQGSPTFASLGPIPANDTVACVNGTMTFDGNYIYVCVGTNVWRRTSVLTVF